jgi:exonuclease III
MPFYPSLKNIELKKRTRIIDNILNLQTALHNQVPPKRLESNLLIATWNIREFGKNSKTERLSECFFYIAEIISFYDLFAIQEIGDDLSDLTSLMKILGPDWDYIVTDVTEGASGNGERLAYLFDKRKVLFRRIAGEIVLPPTKSEEQQQFARSPFIVSFQSGWFKFYMITTHIYYGDDNKKGEKFARRVSEIEAISAFIEKRNKKESANYILLGDFNITGTEPDDPTMEALTNGNFTIPKKLQDLENRFTNKNRNKPYDQIAYIDQPGFMEFGDDAKSAGVFDYYQNVFTKNHEDDYKDCLGAMTYKDWVTYQMSDHLPLWIEFKVNFSENYLNRLKEK